MKSKIESALTVLLLTAVPVACQLQETDPVPSPEIVLTEATNVTDNSVTLTARVTNPEGICQAGFKLKDGSSHFETYNASLKDDTFSISIVHLEYDFTYDFAAFISNGADLSIETDYKQFTTLKDHRDGPDPVDPVPAGIDTVTVSFADRTLQQYMLWYYDEDKDGRISGNEAWKITTIETSSDDILSTEGIEQLTNLRKLHLAGTREENVGHGRISSVDLSGNPYLKDLYMCHNRIDSVDLSPCPNLEFVEFVINDLESIDISMLEAVRRVSVANNRLTRLDARGLNRLEELYFDYNPLTEVLLDNPKLESIHANNTNISSIDLSKCPKLKAIDLDGCENLKTIYLAEGQVIGAMKVSDKVTIVYR